MVDYETEVTNHPTINGVEVVGDLSLTDIGIIELTPEMVSGRYHHQGAALGACGRSCAYRGYPRRG